MRATIGAFVGVALITLLGSAWDGKSVDDPADALVPENDRVAELERRIAQLEERLAAMEQKLSSTWTVPANHWAPTLPTPAWPSVVPSQQSPSTVAPPQPLPQPGEREINGVKFRLYLLSDERPER